MSLLQRNTIASAIFAVMALPVMAQNAPDSSTNTAPSAMAQPHPHGNWQQRQAHMEQRWQKLKSALNLTSDQEAAWNTYLSAMKPQPHTAMADRQAFSTMTTPQRIDAIQALRSQRQAQATQRDQAIKTFYATLAPEQQKTFDTQTLRMFGSHHRGGHGLHGDTQTNS